MTPIDIPDIQRHGIEAAELDGWQLVDWVESINFKQREAVMRRGLEYQRILPSGSIRVNKPWDWQKQQDKAVSLNPDFHYTMW